MNTHPLKFHTFSQLSIILMISHHIFLNWQINLTSDCHVSWFQIYRGCVGFKLYLFVLHRCYRSTFSGFSSFYWKNFCV